MPPPWGASGETLQPAHGEAVRPLGATLLYGAGPRLLEALQLRAKDVVSPAARSSSAMGTDGKIE